MLGRFVLIVLISLLPFSTYWNTWVSGRGLESTNCLDNASEERHALVRGRRDLPQSVIAWGEFQENGSYNAYRSGFPDGVSLDTLAPGYSAYYNTTFAALFRGLPSRCHDDIDESCLLTGLTSLFAQAEVATGNGTHKEYKLPFTMEQKSIIYYYVACTTLDVLPAYCPSACFGDPCGTSNTTEPEPACTQLGLGIHDFRCDCPASWLLNKETGTCERHDICRDKESYPCVRKHTESCNLTKVGFKCNCLHEYMGDDCAEKRNACVQRRIPGLPSGQDTCGYHGNCIPLLGSDIYACECLDGYVDDLIGNDFPDCNLVIDPCGLMPCVHGRCINLLDGNPPYCECQVGYEGSACAETVSSWRPWQPWRACAPNCGEHRLRSRRRECSSSYPQCIGNNTEEGGCPDIACPVDGKWSDWGAWSECPVVCGGERHRTRDCIPSYDLGEQNWGASCPGVSEQRDDCPDICVPPPISRRRRSSSDDDLDLEDDGESVDNSSDLVVEDYDAAEYHDDSAVDEEGGLSTSLVLFILVMVLVIAVAIAVGILKARNKTDDAAEVTRKALLAAKLEQEMLEAESGQPIVKTKEELYEESLLMPRGKKRLRMMKKKNRQK